MGIFELTPSIRADTEAFNKALKELGWTRRQYNNKIKRLGISLSDKTSTKNFLNDALKKIGSSFRYKNIMQAPTKIATEIRMGGVTPGRVGAPENAKIWSDGAKIQKVAEKKFKNVTDQRKFFVDQMKKIYKNIPKKQILHIFKNILKGVKSINPLMLGGDIIMKMMEDPNYQMDFLNQNPSRIQANKGGMMDIDYMTRPLGMQAGGDPIQERKAMMQKAMTLKEGQRRADMETGDPEMQSDSTYGNMSIEDITKLAMTIAQQQGDSSEENIRQIMRQLSAVLPSLQQDMSNERRSPVASGLNSLIDKFGLNRKTNLDRDVSQYRVR